jgi:hypothetical protein
VQGHLLDPVDEVGFRDPGDVEHRLRHVDDVVELATHLTAGREAVRPVHDRPAVRGRRAEPVDVRDHELSGLQIGGIVKGDDLVETCR